MHSLGPDDLREAPDQTAAERRSGGVPRPAEHAVSACPTGRPYRCLQSSISSPGGR
jgi:hypothetical protein